MQEATKYPPLFLDFKKAMLKMKIISFNMTISKQWTNIHNSIATKIEVSVKGLLSVMYISSETYSYNTKLKFRSLSRKNRAMKFGERICDLKASSMS